MGERRRWLQHPCGACVCVCFLRDFRGRTGNGLHRKPSTTEAVSCPGAAAAASLSLATWEEENLFRIYLHTRARENGYGWWRAHHSRSVRKCPVETHRPIGGPDPTGSGVASLCRALVYAAASVRMSAGSTSALCTKNCTLCYYSPVPIWCIHGIYAAKATGRMCPCRCC